MIHNFQFSNSSMLQACSYDTNEKELTVTFMNGKEYTYKDVASNIYQELIDAPSPGKYFNSVKNSLEQK